MVVSTIQARCPRRSMKNFVVQFCYVLGFCQVNGNVFFVAKPRWVSRKEDFASPATKRVCEYRSVTKGGRFCQVWGVELGKTPGGVKYQPQDARYCAPVAHVARIERVSVVKEQTERRDARGHCSRDSTTNQRRLLAGYDL